METLSNDTVHASTSIAPNNAHIDVQNTDELSKEKEEELLYGTGEDGDEEEALSDDSLRLRLSDDEPEIEDITPESTNTSHIKQKTKDMDEKSEMECEVNVQFLNETDTSKEIVKNKNINCKLTKIEDVASNVKINCNDSKSVDNLNDSKNLNNSTSKEKDCQSNVKAQNGEVDNNKEEDLCDNMKQDSTSHKKKKLLDSDCDMTNLDKKKVQNSTRDKHDIVKNCEDKQAIDCTKIIELNECQNDSDDAAPISKNTRLSNIKNGKNKTVQESTLVSDQKVNNSKSDEKILDDKNDSVQTQNYSLKKKTENSNSVKVIIENNVIGNSNQSVSEAINVDSDVNESAASTDNNSITNKSTSLESTADKKSISDNSEQKSVESSKTQRKSRRSRKLSVLEQDTTQENKEEAGRQKRRTAKNAEEIIRKKFLVQDSDIDSSDSSEKLVVVNHKVNQHVRSLSPPSLKRNCPDSEVVIVNGNTKKQKTNSESLNEDIVLQSDHKNDIKNLNYVHKFFRRDLKEKLPKLKQEELEELLIQKIVETITMRSEIGKLREQARLSEKNQEATRTRCQQLAKQIKDFEMVLSRHAADRRANNDKPTPPIKINRSVGLQVNFITDHGVQSLRQLQQNSSLKSVNTPNNASTTVNSSVNETNNNASSPRKGIKIRSPRRPETSGQPAVGQPANVTQTSAQPPPLISTVTPTALVVSKTVDSQHPVNLQNQNSSIQQILSNQQQPLQPQTVVLNGKIPHQTNRQSTTHNVSKTKTNDLIDLTDEEEKSKSTFKNKPSLTITAVTTSTITDSSGNILSKAQPCFPRVIQAIPANVAITSQPASIRVVHTASHPTPTALVNNMNASRLAYVMQGGVGSPTQLLITSSTNQIRPVTACTRSPFTTVAYKAGISTNANGTVRVITTSSGPNVQISKHPAPLPDSPHYAINSALKLPPPAPSLKISKVANGIVLSWNMVLSDKYADIVSYQLYAYQEVAGVPPSTNLWKKVGDVRALPLPMACTLTQFSEGNNYYFAVRAVDTHSRKGQYSTPGNISL